MLILGLVWWVPMIIVCGVLVQKQKLAETTAANLKVAADLMDKLATL